MGGEVGEMNVCVCVGGGGRDECVCVCEEVGEMNVCVCRKEREGVCVEGKNGSGSFNCVVSHIEPDVFYCVHLLHIQYTSILVYEHSTVTCTTC